MPRFDDLAPDQKAVLQLLLKQGKSYADIAGLLRLERTSVRERALDALDVLGADGPAVDELPPERQDELADHLLGQQSAAEQERTQAFLSTSPPGRAWARAVAAELEPVAGDGLPPIPDEPDAAEAEPDTAAEPTAQAVPAEPTAPAAAAERAGPPAAAGAVAAGSGEPAGHAASDVQPVGEQRPRSSRLGGLLILVAVGAVVALGLVLLLGRDSNDSSASSGSTDAPAVAAATCSSGTTGTPAQQQVNLKAPAGGSPKALGFAIIQQGGMQLVVQGLSRSNLYKVWLWNSPTDAVPLGFATYQTKTKRLVGAVQALPAGTSACRTLVITRERSQSATTPGPIVQTGAFKQS